MSRRARDRVGFTLLEVMGVVLATALVVGFATDYYIDLSRASSRAADNTRDIRRATALLDRLARDFESTLLIVKPPEVDPLAHPWLFIGEPMYGESGADHVKFVTRSFQPRRSEEQESDLSVVAYTVRRSEDDDTLELLRWSAPRLPESLDRSYPRDDDEGNVLMAEGLVDFGVTFYDEAGEAKDSWDSTTLENSSLLPTAVEIVVAMAGPDTDAEDFEEAVHYRRRVLLPVRPLDLAVLLDPNRSGGASDQQEEAEEEEEGGEAGADDLASDGGLTVGDCVNLAAIRENLPHLEPIILKNANKPWSRFSAAFAGTDAALYINPGCQ